MMKTAVLLLLAGWQLGGAQDLEACGPSSNADYQYEVIPVDGFEIHWSISADDDTISFQVVSSAVAWTGIGFSSNGMMVGSDAVVGLPDEASVLEYEMTGKSVSNVTPFDVQEITGGSVSQDSSGTTLTFTRPLSPTGDKQTISSTPGDETILIYAYGTDNPLAYHGTSFGDVVLDLYCGDTEVADSGAATLAVTPAPIGAEVQTFAPSSAGSGSPTPAPAAAGGGDRDVGDSADGTPSPSGVNDPLLTTSAPSTAEDGAGQGDADSAFRVGGGLGIAVAATGVMMVVSVLAL